jgi:hypothetical protein
MPSSIAWRTLNSSGAISRMMLAALSADDIQGYLAGRLS